MWLIHYTVLLTLGTTKGYMAFLQENMLVLQTFENSGVIFQHNCPIHFSLYQWFDAFCVRYTLV